LKSGWRQSVPVFWQWRGRQVARGLVGDLLLPEAGFNDFDQPAPTLGRVEKADHYTESIRCAKEGRPTCLPIEFASHLTELALLGTLALRTRKVLEWDTAAMRVTDEVSVNQFADPRTALPGSSQTCRCAVSPP